MRGLIHKDLTAAIRFCRTFRYIDDLLTLNNLNFKNSIDKICPPELELKRTIEGPTTCSYLDLNVSIAGHRFCTDLYDKRDVFNFLTSRTWIVTYPPNQLTVPYFPIS